jgi:hypothetical protein
MTFAAPLFAWVGVAAAAAVVGLHLLAWRRPPETPLPTARFAPERPIRMVSRALRPADLLLLALRAALVLLAGLALAGPRFDQQRVGSARVVVADRSSSVRDGAAVVTAVRRELRDGGALVVFDSVSREVDAATLDSAIAIAPNSPGSISAALVSAIRAARRLEKEHDSVDIVLVSPFAASEIDAATTTVRSLWSGPVRRVRVASTADSTLARGTPELRGDPTDAVLAAVTLNGAFAGGNRVRIIRDSLLTADSAAAREGRTIVVWPTTGSAQWPSRARADTALGATVVDAWRSSDENATVVAAFARAWSPPVGRVVARWADGEPAGTETTLGSGCIRSVAIQVPAAGDLTLTPSFRRFAQRLTAPCGNATAVTLSDSTLDRVLPPTVGRSQSAGVASSVPDAFGTRLTAWLLALALVAAVAEQLFRRRGDHASA